MAFRALHNAPSDELEWDGLMDWLYRRTVLLSKEFQLLRLNSLMLESPETPLPLLLLDHGRHVHQGAELVEVMLRPSESDAERGEPPSLLIAKRTGVIQ